jgi:hypothetical protein
MYRSSSAKAGLSPRKSATISDLKREIYELIASCHWWASGGGVSTAAIRARTALDPSPHRDVIGVQTSLGEQLLDVAIRK